MVSYKSSIFYCFCHFFLLILSLGTVASNEEREVYIVYMGSLPKTEYLPTSHHLNLLQDVQGTSFEESKLITSYKRSFNGFAAMLTPSEAQSLAGKDEVVSVFPNRLYQLQTTRSWDFLGLKGTVTKNPTIESDIIVGIIDTGIWPGSPSFSGQGFGPVPKKWKGVCKGGGNFTCTKKLIGARYYVESSALDNVGHGTHTASTIAGNRVQNVSFYGIAGGTARGGVPSARIAAYKVCTAFGCSSAGILAAFDDAIADGVDIITISVASKLPTDLYYDAVAIGAFHAMQKGVLTSQSAGNSGRSPGTVSSVAPWVLTVGASTTDRRIIDKVILGNGKTLVGHGINAFTLRGSKIPLIYGGDAARACDKTEAGSCSEGCLDRSLVTGKILLCNNGGSSGIKSSGAVGSIICKLMPQDVSYIVGFPSIFLTPTQCIEIMDYIKSTKNPTARLLKSEVIKDPAAPVAAFFSSRGPNIVAGQILKPDISAPGVDIIAAFPPYLPVSQDTTDKRSVKYSFMTGTSMSCPHAAGVAAFLKSFHPDWSPSAIKSAIMTTAFPMNSTKTPEAELAYGSGLVNPTKAINPGLVYETTQADYVNFLCSTYNDDPSMIKIITGNITSCPKDVKQGKDINYPSIAVQAPVSKQFKSTYTRTVTNVGSPTSTYKVNVFSSSKSVVVKVVPKILNFKSLKEKKSFNVTIISAGMKKTSMVSAAIIWSDGAHSVRSPIAVYTPLD